MAQGGVILDGKTPVFIGTMAVRIDKLQRLGIEANDLAIASIIAEATPSYTNAEREAIDKALSAVMDAADVAMDNFIDSLKES